MVQSRHEPVSLPVYQQHVNEPLSVVKAFIIVTLLLRIIDE